VREGEKTISKAYQEISKKEKKDKRQSEIKQLQVI
jgi:hypothetical protein